MATCDDAIKEYVRAMMGSPVIDCELDSRQLDFCVMDAKAWYMGAVGQEKRIDVTSVTGHEYPVPDDCGDVTRVAFERNNRGGYIGIDPSDLEMPIPGMGYRSQYGVGGNQSEHIQILQRREQASRVFGYDNEWEYDSSERVLRLFPTNAPIGRFAYWYLVKDVADLDLSKLEAYPLSLVRQWALSVALTIAAQVRTLFSEFPSANGSFTMNGDSLQTRSELLQSDLDEKIKGWRTPIGFFTD